LDTAKNHAGTMTDAEPIVGKETVNFAAGPSAKIATDSNAMPVTGGMRSKSENPVD
jgi:hypothetical protein